MSQNSQTMVHVISAVRGAEQEMNSVCISEANGIAVNWVMNTLAALEKQHLNYLMNPKIQVSNWDSTILTIMQNYGFG